MTTDDNLRDISALWPMRGRYPVVIACLDDPSPYEAKREKLSALGARLVTETEPGPLSARLGRPAVAVCDRYLEVALCEESPEPDEVVALVHALELRCEECPQGAVDTARFAELVRPSD